VLAERVGWIGSASWFRKRVRARFLPILSIPRRLSGRQQAPCPRMTKRTVTQLVTPAGRHQCQLVVKSLVKPVLGRSAAADRCPRQAEVTPERTP
jgi:hypothetical protein